jgi:sensor histidine kinase regulating citrate/malate metabolism
MGTIVVLLLVWLAVGVLVWTHRLRRVVSLRLSLTCLALSLTLTLALLLIVERRQRASIVRQMEKRGETIATHLAAVSTKSLLTYNFVTLEQDAAQTAQAREVLYTIILDRDGRVAAYSGHSEKQGMVLPDPVSQHATQAKTTLLQYVPQSQGAADHYDIAVPVFVPGRPEKWGTVRVGLSLHEMQRDIAQTRWQALLWSVLSVASSVVVAAFLISQAHRAENGRQS